MDEKIALSFTEMLMLRSALWDSYQKGSKTGETEAWMIRTTDLYNKIDAEMHRIYNSDLYPLRIR